VRFSDQPGVVPDHVVDSLKRTADSETGVHHPQRTLFEPGKIVFIERGLFAGLQAIFQAETAQKRVIVLLEMLGRENRVVVDRNALRSTY
jgi:transcriptional antiterminator RfaH